MPGSPGNYQLSSPAKERTLVKSAYFVCAVVLFFFVSCKETGNKTAGTATPDSCVIAKKFESEEMHNAKIKAGYSGKIEYYWNDDTAIIKSRHIYVNGQLTTSTYYYEEGKPRFNYQFRCGSLHGLQTAYFENGEPDNVIPYSYGYRNGTGIFYNEQGKITMKVPYSHDSILRQPVYFDDSGHVKINVPLNANDSLVVTTKTNATQKSPSE